MSSSILAPATAGVNDKGECEVYNNPGVRDEGRTQGRSSRVVAEPRAMPRYVVLEHDHPGLHWDFMLEAGAVLRTWRLSAPPQPGHSVPATPSLDPPRRS